MSAREVVDSNEPRRWLRHNRIEPRLVATGVAVKLEDSLQFSKCVSMLQQPVMCRRNSLFAFTRTLLRTANAYHTIGALQCKRDSSIP